MRTRSFSTGLLYLAVLLASACAPQFSGTNAVPKPAPQALSVNEDFTLWHPEGMAPTMHMDIAPAVNGQPAGKAQIAFDKAGTLSLSREIPMPGDSVIRLSGTADLDNAAVKAQLWKDGRMLAERGNGGAVDIAVRSAGAGMAKCVLIFSGNGKGSVKIRDAHISIEKSDLSHARIDGTEPQPAH